MARSLTQTTNSGSSRGRSHGLTEPSHNVPALLPPGEISVFVDADGSVTFTDLTADLVEVARLLDPDSAPACKRGIP